MGQNSRASSAGGATVANSVLARVEDPEAYPALPLSPPPPCTPQQTQQPQTTPSPPPCERLPEGTSFQQTLEVYAGGAIFPPVPEMPAQMKKAAQQAAKGKATQVEAAPILPPARRALWNNSGNILPNSSPVKPREFEDEISSTFEGRAKLKKMAAEDSMKLSWLPPIRPPQFNKQGDAIKPVAIPPAFTMKTATTFRGKKTIFEPSPVNAASPERPVYVVKTADKTTSDSSSGVSERSGSKQSSVLTTSERESSAAPTVASGFESSGSIGLNKLMPGAFTPAVTRSKASRKASSESTDATLE
jgi:hypothetical protein